jgi:hypothetical protein
MPFLKVLADADGQKRAESIIEIANYAVRTDIMLEAKIVYNRCGIEG